jgi:hypothetical protein
MAPAMFETVKGFVDYGRVVSIDPYAGVVCKSHRGLGDGRSRTRDAFFKQ